MDAKVECLEVLRGFIERADLDELAEAQGAIIQFAMNEPDRASRSDALHGLREALAAETDTVATDPAQQAYRSVVEAMIDRTREAVLADQVG